MAAVTGERTSVTIYFINHISVSYYTVSPNRIWVKVNKAMMRAEKILVTGRTGLFCGVCRGMTYIDIIIFILPV